eukprot:1189560-Prorocentrum_minimum.AAC.2
MALHHALVWELAGMLRAVYGTGRVIMEAGLRALARVPREPQLPIGATRPPARKGRTADAITDAGLRAAARLAALTDLGVSSSNGHLPCNGWLSQ